MNPAKVTAMLRALGVTDAPMPRAGMTTVVDFFARELHIHLESNSEWQAWFSYLLAIDFHQRVWTETLSAGTLLSRHEPPGGRPKPFVYYTRPGTSQFRTGTSFPTSTFVLYELLAPTLALVSKASGAKFDNPNVFRAGGGIQYIVRQSAATRVAHRQSIPGPRR